MKAGDKIGSYKIEKKLAEGGMGELWVATSKKGDRRVVLKMPKAVDANAKVALADEARMGARLKHPAIVETLEYLEHKGEAVLVTAYVEGANLLELRAHAGALPANAVASIGAAVAGALEAIHEATDGNGKPLAMIHRDVSPGNILVDKNGHALLIDLGIARSSERKQDATKKGLVKGTFRYLAPEVVDGDDHTAASDLWALGVTLWEAALGRFAVSGKTLEALRATLDGTLTRLEPNERIEPELKQALLGLIAPLDRRTKNARVAKSLLSRIAHELGGGEAALATIVGRYVRGEPAQVALATEVLGRDVDVTAAMSRDATIARSTREVTEEAVRTEVDEFATKIKTRQE